MTGRIRTAAVFLDRDGTINVDPGYVRTPEQLELIPGASRALRDLAGRGFKLVLITNQSGIGRGLLTRQTADAIHARLQAMLGLTFDGVYICPHHPTEAMDEYRVDCACRKPRTAMVERALTDLGIDRARSFLVGDDIRDVQCGRTAGVRTVLVLTGGGLTALAQVDAGLAPRPDHVAADLAAAADWILAS